MTLLTICSESIIMMYASSALSYSNEEDVGAYRVRAAVGRRTHSGDHHLVLALLPHPSLAVAFFSVLQFNRDFINLLLTKLVMLGNII